MRPALAQAADLIDSLTAQLAESQRREKAAVEDINLLEDCGVCKHHDLDSCDLAGTECHDPDDGDCRCSNCHICIDALHRRNHGLLKVLGYQLNTFYKYCPNCGAIMDLKSSIEL